MAEQIVSLGYDNERDEIIAYDEEIWKLLTETWDPYFDEDCHAYDPEIYALLHKDLEGLDDPNLFDVCDEQNEWIDDNEDDEWMLEADQEQHGGNPLFSVTRERFGEPRQWKDGTIVQEQMRLRVHQNRAPKGEQLGDEIATAFYENIRDYIRQLGINPKQYRLQLKVHVNGKDSIWSSSPILPVEDWMNMFRRTHEWLDKLAKKLNSADSIDPTTEELYVEFILLKKPGTAGRRKQFNIHRMSYEEMLKKKRCIIAIANKDLLCAARAIVTLKARIDRDHHYEGLKRGRPIQTRLAKQLHQEANVPERACGRHDLEAFQTHLGHQYQLIVVEGLKGHLWFKNDDYNDAPHIIALVKMNNHFHAITSLPAFLNRELFCQLCNKAYNEEVAEKHNCKGQNCSACRRGKKRCKEYKTWVKPKHYCKDCNRMFYSPDCLEAHKRGTEKRKSVCARFNKCKECCKVHRRTKGHHCGYARCSNCGAVRQIHHQCFIQPFKPKKAKENEEENEEYVGQSEEEDDDLPAGGGDDEKPPPLIIAFDIECEALSIEGSEDKLFEPILIGWSTLYEVNDYHEVASIKEFLDAMLRKTNVDGKDRDVYCFAHNLRAFDGLFIQKELYDQGRNIHGILNQGAKYLSFQCGNLIFRDSMNFFAMPLEKLSSTFMLKELHKGFFPYGLISKNSVGFVGEWPAASAYHPDRMKENRRKAFNAWYDEQKGKIFDYDRELSLYLKSDVLILKDALTAFNSEMFALTQVQPLLECVTIASTAFRVWQQNFLTKNLIALEPLGGWMKNTINQSEVALQWLAFEQSKVDGPIEVIMSNSEKPYCVF